MKPIDLTGPDPIGEFNAAYPPGAPVDVRFGSRWHRTHTVGPALAVDGVPCVLVKGFGLPLRLDLLRPVGPASQTPSPPSQSTIVAPAPVSPKTPAPTLF